MASSLSNPFGVVINPGKPAPALPAWVPPPGYFADVPMLNDPKDVTPELYRTSATDSGVMQNPFIIWGGSAILRDFSALGAQVYYSGGHESQSSDPNVQFTLICDFSSMRWSTANVPNQKNASSSFVNGYAPDGTPYCPHTYLGLQELPAAWGGGKQGSLVSFFWAGSNYENRINLMDVSKGKHGYTQLETRQPQNADPTKIRFRPKDQGNSFPITVMDTARQGWWVASIGGLDYTLFVSKTGEITQYPALGGNLANGSLVLAGSQDLLIAIDGGYSSGGYKNNAHRTLYFRNLKTGAMSTSLTLGEVPSRSDGYDGGTNNFHRPDSMGLQWVEELGCIVGLDQTVSPPAVVKLVPPPANLATDPWTWITVTSLQHWPQDSGGTAQLQGVLNNIWSKFRWVPSLRSFVYCTARDRKPQIIRLA